MKLLLLFILLANNSQALTLNVNPTRLVRIVGEVGIEILDQADKIERISRTPGNLFILINSFGGSVSAGDIFISSIKLAQARGVKVHCVVSSVAASMAFSILANCSYRYAFSGSQLLFHPASAVLRASMNSLQLSRILKRLIKLDKEDLRFLRRSTGMEPSILVKAYYIGGWWSVQDLIKVTRYHWIREIDNITGVEQLFVMPGVLK